MKIILSWSRFLRKIEQFSDLDSQKDFHWSVRSDIKLRLCETWMHIFEKFISFHLRKFWQKRITSTKTWTLTKFGHVNHHIDHRCFLRTGKKVRYEGWFTTENKKGLRSEITLAFWGVTKCSTGLGKREYFRRLIWKLGFTKYESTGMMSRRLNLRLNMVNLSS